jgi:hypothetical protein
VKEVSVSCTPAAAPSIQVVASPAPSTPLHRGLTLILEQRLRRRLRGVACSEAWIDAQFHTVAVVQSNGRAETRRIHDPRVFPPGGPRRTKMKWCRTCGRYTPPSCMHLIERRASRDIADDVISATLVCDDCHIAAEDESHRELYDAFPHLRPAGSTSFVRLRELFSQRRKAR